MGIRIRTGSGLPLQTIGTRALDEYKSRAESAGDAAMNELQRKAILLVSQRGHGRTYSRGRGRTHQASAPGEPPARDFGLFARSISWARKGFLRWQFGSGSIVGLWLERGTRRMRPRPWLIQSFNAAGPAMRLALRRVLGRG